MSRIRPVTKQFDKHGICDFRSSFPPEIFFFFFTSFIFLPSSFNNYFHSGISSQFVAAVGLVAGLTSEAGTLLRRGAPGLSNGNAIMSRIIP